MKRLLILLFILANCTICFSQSKTELKKEIGDLKLMIEAYKQTIKEKDMQLQDLRHEYANLQVLMVKIGNILNTENVVPTPNVSTEKKENSVMQQCKAITASGSQCSRKVEVGSDYCWQHKKTKTTSGSREIHTGPRGGKYYINSSGKKVYVKRKK